MRHSLKNKKKAQLDSSFGWIFAVIVGAFILFLAIYGVTKFMNLQKIQQSAETGKTIDILLNPLETGFESGQKVLISSPTDTRISAQCDTLGIFGKQKIQTLQKVFNQWTDGGINIILKNKYIFAESPVEGKNFYAFSKPFEFPVENSYDFSYKIADLIYLTSADDKYCFSNAPEQIKSEIKSLNQANILIDNCTSDATIVCFNPSDKNCDVRVSYQSGTVVKKSGAVRFETDALMYAAVFSDNQTYECQLQRIMKRAKQITILYEEKSRIEKKQGCSGDIETDLIIFENLLNGYKSSDDLFGINNQAKTLNKINSNGGECKLW